MLNQYEKRKPDEEASRREFIATFACTECHYEEVGHVFEADSREAALELTLDCPNCEETDGLAVQESTLRRHTAQDEDSDASSPN
jgi:Zn ribbon nucleic-acid-binding protein